MGLWSLVCVPNLNVSSFWNSDIEIATSNINVLGYAQSRTVCPDTDAFQSVAFHQQQNQWAILGDLNKKELLCPPALQVINISHVITMHW